MVRVLFSASYPETRPGTGISGEARWAGGQTRGEGHTFGRRGGDPRSSAPRASRRDRPARSLRIPPGRGSRGTLKAGTPVWGGAQERGRANSEAERVCASDSATQPR